MKHVETEQDIPFMVLELVDRRKSGWVLDGSEESGLPKYLDSPSDKTLKTTSVVKVPNKKGEGYTLRKIRYIQGCDLIYVDEQDKAGIKPNPAVDKADLTFKNGIKHVRRNGGTIGLYDYLKKYEGNIDNPLAPSGAEPVFMEIKSAKNAEEAISSFDDELAAKTYLSHLKSTDTDKKVTYKEKELEFLCNLFKLPFLASPSEKFEALINIATKDPKRFNDSIVNEKSSMLSEVTQGIHMGVIAMDTTKAMLTANDKVLLQLKAKNQDAQIEELSLFFLTGAGEMPYKQFSIELRAAKERALAVEK